MAKKKPFGFYYKLSLFLQAIVLIIAVANSYMGDPIEPYLIGMAWLLVFMVGFFGFQYDRIT